MAAISTPAMARGMNVPLKCSLVEKSLQMMTAVTARKMIAGSGWSGVR